MTLRAGSAYRCDMLSAVSALLDAVTTWRPNPKGSRFEGLDLADVGSASEQLVFRRPTHGDVETIIALNSQPSAMQANGWDAQTAEENAAFLRSEGFANFTKLALVATLTTGEVVGIASLATHQGRTDEISIGIHINDAHSGHGFGTELMAVMIAATRSSGYAGKLWVGTATSNTGLQRIMDRLGYDAGAPEPYVAPNGQPIDSVWYAIP